MSRAATVVLILCVIPAIARAEAAPPVFAVQTADGKAVEGALQELGPDWSVRVGGDKARVEGADLLGVRRAGMPLPPPPSEAQLLLVGGDCLPVSGGPVLIGERVHFRCPCLAEGKDTSVPLSAVSVIWYAGSAGEIPERLRRRLTRETRKRDVVLLLNGDVLEGVLTALDEKAVTIEADRKPVTVGVAQTAAVGLSSDLTEAPHPGGVYGRITLIGGETDGMRLSLASARCADGATLTGATLFGAALSVPLSKVAALDLYQGKAVRLSELNPSRYEYFPYLDEHWDYAKDADVTGLDLRLAGSTHDRGVGMHSHSRLTYDAPKGSRRFEALVGLDDRTGRHGNARVRVLADGKALDIGDGELKAGSAPLAVRADVAGARELTLEVDFGKDGPVQGHVDWVDAQFVK